METQTQVTYFNRHESMDSDTRHKIMDLISDLQIIENCSAGNVINMLYGSFDGFDYSERIKKDQLLTQLNNGGNAHLAMKILIITSKIEKYPRTAGPNNNQF